MLNKLLRSKTNTPQEKEGKPTHTDSESPQKPTTPSEEENTGTPEALVAQIEEFRESLNSLCPQLRGENPYRKVNMTVENVRKIAQDSWVAGCMAGIALQNLE